VRALPLEFVRPLRGGHGISLVRYPYTLIPLPDYRFANNSMVATHIGDGNRIVSKADTGTRQGRWHE
jgi:hypothetical protein